MLDLGRPVLDLLSDFHARTQKEESDLARTRELLRTAPDPWSRTTPLHLTSSALVVHPATERVLLRWHARQQAWLQVGGHGDPGETEPIDIALREGREETGLTDLEPASGGAVVQVVIVDVPASDREPAHEHVDLRFVLATEEPERARPEKPDAPLRWLDFSEARELTHEGNVHEMLDRTERLMAKR